MVAAERIAVAELAPATTLKRVWRWRCSREVRCLRPLAVENSRTGSLTGLPGQQVMQTQTRGAGVETIDIASTTTRAL